MKDPDMEKATGPKTKAGTIDWEVMFENPDTGLIALISQAHSAHALHAIVLAIIKQIYTRKDDSHNIEHITEELQSLIPDDANDDDLPHLIEGINVILREIKEECIRKAVEHVEHGKHADSDEKRDAAKHAVKAKKKQKKKKKKKRKKLKTKKKKVPVGYWIVGGIISVMAVSVIIYFSGGLEKGKSSTQILIDQMKAAVEGEAVDLNAYQGKLKVEEKYGRITVSVHGIPADVCSSAAWYFVNRGNVIINGRMPRKISPNILNEHCNRNPEGAILTWVSKKTVNKGD